MQTNQAIYKEYYDKVDVKDALYSRINEIKQTLSIVTEVDKWAYRYQEGKWTIKDMIQHCIDCERIFSYRALHIARQDPQALFLFDENSYANLARANDRKAEDLYKEWMHLMNATFYQFEKLSNDELKRVSNIGGNSYSLEDIGYTIAGHSIHHINVIKERYL